MLNVSRVHQYYVFFILILLLIITRGHHFTRVDQLPGASWAVFFLAGIYLQPKWMPLALLGCVFGLDILPLVFNDGHLAITFNRETAYCLTPAYFFLFPAYGALWLSGHWYASRHSFQWQTLIPLSTAFLVGAVMCELISSGSFYFFSGYFDEPTLVEFASRVLRYFPPYLQSMLFYLTVAIFLHVLTVFSIQGSSAFANSGRHPQ